MAGERVLIVDDEEAICKICDLEVTRMGLRSQWKSNPLEALELIKSSHLDLLVTDVKMPGMNGIDLLQAAQKHNPSIAAIMMTAYPTLDMAMQALQKGVTSFIRKPFRLDDFRFTLQDVLEKLRLLRENMRLKALVNLLNVSEQISIVRDPQRLYALVMRAAIQETGATRGKIYQLDESSHELVLEFESSLTEVAEDTAGNEDLPAPAAVDAAYWAEESPPGPATETAGETRNVVSIPLQVRDRVKGLLSLYHDRGGSFSQVDLDIAKILATQTAIALDNSELVQQIEKLFLETIGSLASSLDEKDPYTHGHSQRVSEISVEIASRLDLGQNMRDYIGLAGSLHDIGKIGIPDRILQKPGPLSDEEYAIIKTHPEKGAKILNHIQRLRPVVEAVYTHHEWWNGCGYPRGLKGDEIPLSGTIISVADALDTITSDRPYRKGRSQVEAYEILAKCAGKQFHPDVVAAVLREPLRSLK